MSSMPVLTNFTLPGRQCNKAHPEGALLGWMSIISLQYTDRLTIVLWKYFLVQQLLSWLQFRVSTCRRCTGIFRSSWCMNSVYDIHWDTIQRKTWSRASNPIHPPHPAKSVTPFTPSVMKNWPWIQNRSPMATTTAAWFAKSHGKPGLDSCCSLSGTCGTLYSSRSCEDWLELIGSIPLAGLDGAISLNIGTHTQSTNLWDRAQSWTSITFNTKVVSLTFTPPAPYFYIHR